MNDQQLDDFFRKKIRSNEEIFPDSMGDSEELWRVVLNRKAQKRRWRYVSGIAASLCLIVASLIFWDANKSADADLQEISDMVFSMYTEKEALDYIHLQCKKKNPSCQSSEFVELKSEVDRSFSELRELEKQITLFGDDPVLLKARARIENQRGRIIKEIMLML